MLPGKALAEQKESKHWRGGVSTQLIVRSRWKPSNGGWLQMGQSKFPPVWSWVQGNKAGGASGTDVGASGAKQGHSGNNS